MDLQDEEQDDYVPLEVVRQFAAALHAGAARLMADVLSPDVAAAATAAVHGGRA